MNDNIIKMMIQEGCIDHGHFEFGNIHTDNFVKKNFIFNYKIADILLMKLYKIIKDIEFNEIIPVDNTASLISLPISLMLKRNIYDTKIIHNENQISIALASIIKPEDFENITKQIKLTTKSIFCLFNYSGNDRVNGIPITNVLNINTWKSTDCPYCKDIPNE